MDGIDLIRAVSCRTSLECDWKTDGSEAEADGRSGEGLVGSLEVNVEIDDASDIPWPQAEMDAVECCILQSNCDCQSAAGPDTGERYLHAWLLDPYGEETDRIFPLPLQGQLQFRMQAETPVLWNAELPRCYELVLEICDGGGECLERRTQPAAFYKAETLDGKLYVNWRETPVRPGQLPPQPMEMEQLREFLGKMKRDFRNALIAPPERRTEELKTECIRYGIYLPTEEKFLRNHEWDLIPRTENSARPSNPDVELQVVQTGVLIENHSVFLNTSEYELFYEVTANPSYQKSGVLQADVPPGSSRFLEVPFEPLPEPGIYTFYAALRLKKETVWGRAGFVVAEGKTCISGFYENRDA